MVSLSLLQCLLTLLPPPAPPPIGHGGCSNRLAYNQPPLHSLWPRRQSHPGFLPQLPPSRFSSFLSGKPCKNSSACLCKRGKMSENGFRGESFSRCSQFSFSDVKPFSREFCRYFKSRGYTFFFFLGQKARNTENFEKKRKASALSFRGR